MAENRKLARETLSIQEEERKHLARELHDGLGAIVLTRIDDAADDMKPLRLTVTDDGASE